MATKAGDQPVGQWAQRLGMAAAAFALVVLAVAGAYAVGDAILAPIPIAKSPGFVETVLASRAVVASVRIAVIFAAAFVVASVVALVARGQWPTRIGPVHVAEQVSGLDAENQRLKESLENARDAIDNLKSDLAESNRLVDEILEPK